VTTFSSAPANAGAAVINAAVNNWMAIAAVL
jgi:hypothetical protein